MQRSGTYPNRPASQLLVRHWTIHGRSRSRQSQLRTDSPKKIRSPAGALAQKRLVGWITIAGYAYKATPGWRNHLITIVDLDGEAIRVKA